MRSGFFALLLLVLLACSAGTTLPHAGDRGIPALPQRTFETFFYLRNNDAAIRSFAAHAQHISIIGPQTFNISAAGELRGQVAPRILEIARSGGVKVMPLFLNPGFDQAMAHALLDDPAARFRAVRTMVDLAVADHFWGWQFDMENIHASYRDRLTAFYREAADALHAAGKTISIAVVPTDGSAGDDAFSEYMQENWRNSFDVAALAEIGLDIGGPYPGAVYQVGEEGDAAAVGRPADVRHEDALGEVDPLETAVAQRIDLQPVDAERVEMPQAVGVRPDLQGGQPVGRPCRPSWTAPPTWPPLAWARAWTGQPKEETAITMRSEHSAERKAH